MSRRASSGGRQRKPAAAAAPALKRAGPGRSGGAVGSGAIKTLLVDDHTIVREGVRVLLEMEADIAVVGEAADGREATVLARRLRPDVVVMDIAMPELNGLESVRQIMQEAPGTRVVILSAHHDDEYVARAGKLGALGYVLKESSCDDLADAVRTVFAGRPYLTKSIPRRLKRLISAAQGNRASQQLTPEPSSLSRRETEVLQLVAEGKANKQAAASLGISIKTVEKHRQNLMRKLDIHDVAGLTRYAIAEGVIVGRNRREFG